MTLILASNNLGKHREFKAILEPMGYGIIPQMVAGIDFEVNETGDTFEENAFLKASTIARFTNHPAVADDSGLCVDARGGAPGVYSARYGGGKDWTDEQKFRYLLDQMKDVEDRRAKFVCCICCMFPNGKMIQTRGECPGRILLEPRGENGFGYDPIFAPDGYDQSFAELGEEIKDKISHRARALAAFQKGLEDYGYVDG